jgi:hypothetical protein
MSLLSVAIADEFLHKSNVVILWNSSILLQIRTLVLWHGLQQLIDDFVWYQRVSKIELGHIWLILSLVEVLMESGEVIPCHLQPLGSFGRLVPQYFDPQSPRP